MYLYLCLHHPCILCECVVTTANVQQNVVHNLLCNVLLCSCAIVQFKRVEPIVQLCSFIGFSLIVQLCSFRGLPAVVVQLCSFRGLIPIVQFKRVACSSCALLQLCSCAVVQFQRDKSNCAV